MKYSIGIARMLAVSLTGVDGLHTPTAAQTRNSITLQIVATLASQNSFSLSKQLSGVRQLSDGGFLATFWDDSAGRVIRFDASGRFVSRRALGSHGEVRVKRPLISVGPKLLAFDTSDSLAWMLDNPDSVLSVATFAFVPWVNEVLPLDDGRFVTAGALRQRGVSGQPIHIFSRDWKWIRSFGLARPRFRADESILLWRNLARCRNEPAFWSVPRTEHRLEKWDFDGRPIASIDVTPDWFTPRLALADSLSRLASARVVGVDCDAADRLWVVSLVPEVGAGLDGIKDAAMHGEKLNTILDTYVEVIDSHTREVLAVRRFNEAFAVHVGQQLVGWFDASASTVSLRIVRLSLQPVKRQPKRSAK